MSTPATPVLSVVVAIVSDTTEARAGVAHLAECLDALSHQTDAPTMEVVVPYHRNVDGIEETRQRYPDVVFVPVTDLNTLPTGRGGREHHDQLRARGLAEARGEIIGLLEDHARPTERWCAEIVAAHREPYAAIGGAIENGVDTALNWAVYYCDFGRYQNPVPSGESPFASDANVSYKRSALEAIRHVWEDSFHETVVNGALLARGERLALSPTMIVYQRRQGLRLGAALRERFIWGRSYAASRSGLVGSRRWLYAALSPLLAGVLTLRMASNVRRRRRHVGKFLRTLPLIVVFLMAWSLGELLGYVTSRSG